MHLVIAPVTLLLSALLSGYASASDMSGATNRAWTVGTPIVTYWAGPAMTDAAARQMKEGGWNLVWCTEADLDVAQRHGLRAQLQDGLISPASLEDTNQRPKLDALIDRVSKHPALYDYFITDEPSATNFAALGKLVAYLRQRDPAHLAYINLFPTYANNEQLGTKGDTVTAYQKHVDQYVATVKPGLISYDHYQLAVEGDRAEYFLNLAMIRRKALEAGVPFLNIVQAATWDRSMRVPTPDEMRYLVYTSLAYGAQGISYYVYSCGGHTGMIAHADGTPTERYDLLKTVNPDFVAIATELQPLKSVGAYHAGMMPPGALPLPEDAVFQLEPPVPPEPYKRLKPVQGVLLGCFGPPSKDWRAPPPTHVLVVNLSYKDGAVVGLVGPRRLEVFDGGTRKWSGAGGKRAEIRLPRGGGKLVRVKS